MSQCRPIGLATAAAWLAAFLVLVLAGCAAPEPVRTSRRPPASTAQKPPPIAARALNVTSDCTFRDPTGYRGAMKLHVANAEVRTFEVQAGHAQPRLLPVRPEDFPARPPACPSGAPRPGFGLTGTCGNKAIASPLPSMTAPTVCSAGAYLYLWPILADARSKGCG